jgi:sec-independent protein translocase protein TatC
VENITSLESPQLKAAIDKYYPFLVEVRKRVVFTFIVFAATTIFGFFFYEKIIKFLIDILNLSEVNLVFTSPFQFINLAIATGIATGLIFSLPLIVFQILSFLKPALRKKEYRIVMSFLPFSFVLFILGFFFGALVMRWQIDIFVGKSVSIGIGNVLDISRLLTTVIITSALMGLSFQFPIVILLLLRMKVLKPKFFGKIRPFVYVGSLIFAVLLPPDSILADILLSLPLIILFEATLILNRIFTKPS